MRSLALSVAVFCIVSVVRADGPGSIDQTRKKPGAALLDTRALTSRIDAVLAARWAHANVRPAPVADDGEFQRRISLDLIGKIPTAAEARDFLDDPSKVKRLALVERLLDSPAYTARATEALRKVLLPEADTDDVARPFAGGFEAWLKKKVIEEAGYDRIVREILTAKLNTRNPDAAVVATTVDASPAAYFDAKERKPENLASGVSRVFLGIRLECARVPQSPVCSLEAGTVLGSCRIFRRSRARDSRKWSAHAPRP